MEGEAGEVEGSNEEQETHVMDISDLGAVPQGDGSRLGFLQKLQSRIMRVVLAIRAGQLLEDLRVQVNTEQGRRALARYMGARSKRAMVWVAYLGTTPNEIMVPDLYRETLV